MPTPLEESIYLLCRMNFVWIDSRCTDEVGGIALFRSHRHVSWKKPKIEPIVRLSSSAYTNCSLLLDLRCTSPASLCNQQTDQPFVTFSQAPKFFGPPPRQCQLRRHFQDSILRLLRPASAMGSPSDGSLPTLNEVCPLNLNYVSLALANKYIILSAIIGATLKSHLGRQQRICLKGWSNIFRTK